MCAFPISVGSGATLASELISGEHRQLIAPVSLNPIPAGTNFVGLTTTVIGSAIPAGANYIGLASVNIGGTVTVDATGQGDVPITLAGETVGLSAGANFVGLTTAVIGNQPTVNLGTTDNAVLDAIQAATEGTQTAVEILDNIVAGSEAQVDVVAQLPAGANFIGLVTTTVGNTVTVGSHNVTNAGTFAVQNDAAIPTGSNYIGLATVDIGTIPTVTVDATGQGDVPITLAGETVVLGTGANWVGLATVHIANGSSGGTSSTDDSAFTAGSGSGTPMMAFATSDVVDAGDVGVVAMDTSRNLKVSIEADNAGIGGGAQYTEDDAAAANPVGNMLMGVRDDVLSGQTTTDGDNIAARFTDKGEVYVKHADDVTIADGGNSITVDNGGTFAVQSTLQANSGVDIGDVDVLSVIPGTGATNLGKAEDSPHSNGDTGVFMLAIHTDSGSSYTSASGDYGPLVVNEATGALFVDNEINTTAHGGSDLGGPTKIGGRAQEPESQPDEVSDNNRVDALFDRNGYQRVRGDFDPSFADINDSTSGDNTIVAAAGVGKRIAVWSVAVVSDGTTDVRFEDGAAGTAFTGQIPLQAREGFTYSAGGLVPLWVGSANTLLNLELTAAVNVHGHVSYTVIDD